MCTEICTAAPSTRSSTVRSDPTLLSLGTCRTSFPSGRVAPASAQDTIALETIDVVLTPSIAALAWPKRESHPTVIDGQAVGPRGHAVYTGWVNAAGLPALAVPVRPAPDGNPIGVQLVAAPGAESLLLETAGPLAERLGLA